MSKRRKFSKPLTQQEAGLTDLSKEEAPQTPPQTPTEQQLAEQELKEGKEIPLLRTLGLKTERDAFESAVQQSKEYAL